MRILALGDIVGHVAIDYLADKLWAFRSKEKIDFCVANGENATEIRGISVKKAHEIHQSFMQHRHVQKVVVFWASMGYQ